MITYRVDLRRNSTEPWTAQTRTGTKRRAQAIAAFYQGHGFQVAVVIEGGKQKVSVPPREQGRKEPLGTATAERKHELGCSAGVGRACTCAAIRKERGSQYSQHTPEQHLGNLCPIHPCQICGCQGCGPDAQRIVDERHAQYHSQHITPVRGCDRCDDLLMEAREVQDELRNEAG